VVVYTNEWIGLIGTVVKDLLSIVPADGESFLEAAQGVPLVRKIGYICCCTIVSFILAARLITCFGLSPKKITKGKKPGKGGNRFWKNIGLGFKTPREAVEGMNSFFSTLWLVLSSLLAYRGI
jgi:hypothetical protein